MILGLLVRTCLSSQLGSKPSRQQKSWRFDFVHSNLSRGNLLSNSSEITSNRIYQLIQARFFQHRVHQSPTEAVCSLKPHGVDHHTPNTNRGHTRSTQRDSELDSLAPQSSKVRICFGQDCSQNSRNQKITQGLS